MNIKTLFCPNKVTKVNLRKIEYIIIHYTAGVCSKTGNAKNIASYFKTSTTETSADFVVDDTEIYQCNPDVKNYYTWAIGGSKYTLMTTSEGGKYYGKCTNKNSISIEICSNKTNTKTLNALDTDWYFTDKELNLTAELVKYLMKEYNINIGNVIMHHHVTGKICPNPFCINQNRLGKWYAFKEKFNTNTVKEEKREADLVVDTMNIQVNGKDLKINRILKDGKNYIEVAGLKNAGFEVGYNSATKLVTLNNSIKTIEINVDDKKSTIEVVNIKGLNYCPLRSISNVTKTFDVDYINNKVIIKTKHN